MVSPAGFFAFAGLTHTTYSEHSYVPLSPLCDGLLSCLLVLRRTYGTAAVNAHNYSSVSTSVTFGGTVLGMLLFGYLSDKMGRKFGMVRVYTI